MDTPKINNAKFVEEITVIDPDTKLPVEIEIFKHENGGMFGIDASYLDQHFDDYFTPIIYDPFFPINESNNPNLVELTNMEDENNEE